MPAKSHQRKSHPFLELWLWSNESKESEVTHSCPGDSLRPHGLQPIRLLSPWDFPGKSTGVGCYFLLQGIFLTQGSNPGLPHCRGILFTVWATREEIQWRLGHFLNLMIKHCLLNLGLSKSILNSKKDLIFTRNIILYSILVTSISHGWPPDYSWYLPVSRNATTQLSQS